jgi:hypothetical protein
MRQNITLTITSLLTLVLFSLHLTDDVLHDKAGLDTQGTIICLAIMLVLLYGQATPIGHSRSRPNATAAPDLSCDSGPEAQTTSSRR